ncbi:hypothetical protein PGT21_013732 [Puccinia graminis f. sp. tritici]|uniref:Uncharacterized protein n=1 Tax=Puccinia graminis f. sp. tritici TaxID=56615 RepID=A0A5B0RGX7_PUCGR|nr:hypothetical protein PGT21_013732 [Puccinia graminis f. sp. tritici]KAA1125151.1 hypothetical protein PGTUg99_004718 [Puccinia graminis f. sp. tritici]
MSTRDPHPGGHRKLRHRSLKRLSPSLVRYQSANFESIYRGKASRKELGKDTLGTASTLSAASWIQSSPQRVNLPDPTTELALMTMTPKRVS